MDTFITKINVGKLKSIASFFNFVICYLTFWKVDSKQMDFTITQNHISYLIAALLIGVGTYLTITIVKLIVEKTIDQKNKEIIDALNEDRNNIDTLTQRVFIHDVISFHRAHEIYPDLIKPGVPYISSRNRIQAEIRDIREDFRINRDIYKLSLDTVEDQLKLMYGDYYSEKTVVNTN